MFLSSGYFLRYSHLAIPAKLHGPKGDRINESLLYTYTCMDKIISIQFSAVVFSQILNSPIRFDCFLNAH